MDIESQGMIYTGCSVWRLNVMLLPHSEMLLLFQVPVRTGIDCNQAKTKLSQRLFATEKWQAAEAETATQMNRR